MCTAIFPIQKEDLGINTTQILFLNKLLVLFVQPDTSKELHAAHSSSPISQSLYLCHLLLHRNLYLSKNP